MNVCAMLLCKPLLLAVHCIDYRPCENHERFTWLPARHWSWCLSARLCQPPCVHHCTHRLTSPCVSTSPVRAWHRVHVRPHIVCASHQTRVCVCLHRDKDLWDTLGDEDISELIARGEVLRQRIEAAARAGDCTHLSPRCQPPSQPQSPSVSASASASPYRPVAGLAAQQEGMQAL